MQTRDSKSLQDFDLNITKEFIAESIKHASAEHRKKGGPYNKKDRLERRNEVYRLHFDYGYSAVKIANLMNVNRNTINGDIDYWYSKIFKTNRFEPELHILINIKRLETQRTRLRERLDKATETQEKIALERLIYEVESKILQIYFKLAESSSRVYRLAIDWINDVLKKDKMDKRYLTFFDRISVSEKAQQRIKRIINEDKSKVNQ